MNHGDPHIQQLIKASRARVESVSSRFITFGAGTLDLLHDQEKITPIQRRRGRPRLYDEPMRSVGTRLPKTLHERLMSLSNRSGRSVQDLLREAVAKLLS